MDHSEKMDIVDSYFEFTKKLMNLAPYPDVKHRFRFMYIVRRALLVIVTLNFMLQYKTMQTGELVALTSTVCIEYLTELKVCRHMTAKALIYRRMRHLQSHLLSLNILPAEEIYEIFWTQSQKIQKVVKFLFLCFFLTGIGGYSAVLMKFFFDYEQFFETFVDSQNRTITYYTQKTSSFSPTPPFMKTSRWTFILFSVVIDSYHFNIFCCISATDSVFFILTNFISTHIKCLKLILDKLGSKVEETRVIENKFHRSAAYLEEVLQLCDVLESHFTFTILVQIIISTATIGFILYLQTTMKGADGMLVAYILYLFSITVQIFLFCFFGTALTSAAEVIPFHLYHVQWILLGRKSFQLSIMIVSARMLRPIHVTVGKVKAISLRTFLEIVKAAYSLVAVLNRSSKAD